MAHLLLSPTDIDVITQVILTENKDELLYGGVRYPGGKYRFSIEHDYGDNHKDQYIMSSIPFNITENEMDELVLRVTDTYTLCGSASEEEHKLEPITLAMMKDWLDAPSPDPYIILKPKEDIMGVFRIDWDYHEESYVLSKEYPEEDNVFNTLPEMISSIILDYSVFRQHYIKESLSQYLRNLTKLLSHILNVEIGQMLVHTIVDYVH